jgi:IPT/TIG domain
MMRAGGLLLGGACFAALFIGAQGVPMPTVDASISQSTAPATGPRASSNPVLSVFNQPVLDSLTPSSGPTTGGNDVVIGASAGGLTGSTAVDWNGTALPACGSAPCFTVTDDTHVTVSGIPSGSAGGVPVDVVTLTGTTAPLTYTYVAGPTLTSLTPASGSTAGGNDVVLGGTNFTGVTGVSFAGSALPACGTAPCFTFGSDTQITISGIPPGAAGGVLVNVTTPGGTSANLSYTYVTGPTLTSLTPSSGSTAGGINVVITGANFTGVTGVFFGSALPACGTAPCFTFTDDAHITVSGIPPGAAGGVNVNVTTAGGTSASLTYTYVAGPTVTGVSPNAGAPAGGNKVTLTGTDFEAAGTPITSQVTVGSTAITATPCVTTPTAPCFTVTSATSITIQVLPAGTGMINITVTTSGGTSATSSANVYTYVAVFPNVLTVSPKYGAAGGGAYVTIFGSNFGNPSQGFGATEVDFGTSPPLFPCSGSTTGCFAQIGTTTLDVYTAAVPAGTVDIRVVTPGGTSNVAPPADQYTFVAAGAFTAVNPFRTCDTRPAGPGIASNQCDTGGKGTLGTGHETITVQITGAQVPSGAQAVVVNITAINHSGTGTYVIAYPAGGSVPLASNINLSGGKVESNLTIVRLSVSGQISLFNAAGTVDVIVDLEGYFASPTGTSAGAFHAIPPLRICDSRGGTLCATATGSTTAPLSGGVWRHVIVSGLPPGAPTSTPDIPSDGTAAAAAFNLTATGGTVSTFLSVAVPTSADLCPTKAPSFSNENPTPGISLPIRVISNLGPKQDICLYSAAGKINFLIDNNGWFGRSTAPAGAFFYSVPPTRICDTRPSYGTRCQSQPLGANFSELIHVAGIVAVPAWNAQALKPVAVVANLTGISGSSATYLTLYPGDAASVPRASDLNPTASEVIANLAITSLAQTGTLPGNVKLYNALGTVNAILDVSGWFQ